MRFSYRSNLWAEVAGQGMGERICMRSRCRRRRQAHVPRGRRGAAARRGGRRGSGRRGGRRVERVEAAEKARAGDDTAEGGAGRADACEVDWGVEAEEDLPQDVVRLCRRCRGSGAALCWARRRSHGSIDRLRRCKTLEETSDRSVCTNPEDKSKSNQAVYVPEMRHGSNRIHHRVGVGQVQVLPYIYMHARTCLCNTI